MRGVGHDFFFLRVDVLQVGQLHGPDVAHGLKHATAVGTLAIAPGDGNAPVGGRLQGLGQDGFNALHELLGAQHQTLQRRKGHRGRRTRIGHKKRSLSRLISKVFSIFYI